MPFLPSLPDDAVLTNLFLGHPEFCKPLVELSGAIMTGPSPFSIGERELIATIGEAEPTGVPRLDVALLGMGEDGHTASLFPHSPALRAAGDLAVFNDGETIAPPRPRMTMTYRLINAARHITPLVTGAAKRDALARVALADGFDPALPITGVNPAHEDGKLAWRLDAEAAGPASSG